MECPLISKCPFSCLSGVRKKFDLVVVVLLKIYGHRHDEICSSVIIIIYFQNLVPQPFETELNQGKKSTLEARSTTKLQDDLTRT